MSGAIKSASVSLASIFDPYVAGTTKARAAGIDDAGNDISNLYANITYGSAAAATGIKSISADLNTLYAKIGTAAYSLPIQGNAYSQATLIPHSSSGSATLTFNTTGSGWSVSGSGVGTLTPAAATRDSGSLPAGATSVKYATSINTGSGGTVVNGATSAVAVGSSPYVSITQNGTGTGPGNDVKYNITVTYYNSGGGVISTTTFTFEVSYEGSA